MTLQATRYALTGMLHLARVAPATRSATVIARDENMPAKFLQNLLVELRRAGLVKSTTGVLGGYALTRPAETISVADIIRALSKLLDTRGPQHRVQAPGGEAYDRVEAFLSRRRERMLLELEQTSLADLLASRY